MTLPLDIPLVALKRGIAAESVHLGSISVVSDKGTRLLTLGDDQTRRYLRSTTKLIQILPIARKEIVDKYGLTEQYLALAASSHSGEPVHIDAIRRWLGAIGILEEELLCGEAFPLSRRRKTELKIEARPPLPIYNNNSGRHAALLTLCRFYGYPIKDYVCPSHPVQQLIRERLKAILNRDLPKQGEGIENCNLPAYQFSLYELASSMASVYGRIINGKELRKSSLEAALLGNSYVNNPILVAGTDRLTTKFMQMGQGELLLKSGSEGTFAGCLVGSGVGFSLKIADGSQRAADIVVAHLLDWLGKNLVFTSDFKGGVKKVIGMWHIGFGASLDWIGPPLGNI